MGKFNFEVLEKEKIVNCVLDGFFDVSDAENFKKKYAEMVDSLDNSKNYELHIDSKEMTVIKATLLEGLGKVIKQYTLDFKNVVIIERKDKKLLKVQANKVIEKLGMLGKIDIKDV